MFIISSCLTPCNRLSSSAAELNQTHRVMINLSFCNNLCSPSSGFRDGVRTLCSQSGDCSAEGCDLYEVPEVQPHDGACPSGQAFSCGRVCLG